MVGVFDEAPYPQLCEHDFGPNKQYRVSVDNNGKSIAIGDHSDAGFQRSHIMTQPDPGTVDVIIHGLLGRFIDRFGGQLEIPPAVVATLLIAAGV